MENTKSEDCYPKAENTKTETKKLAVEKSESEERKLKEAKDILNSIIKSETDGDKSERNQVLKRKLTEDGATIERVLSEGETSSGFETVSSINFNDICDIDDLELSSLNDCNREIEENFNVIVQIENELAYRNKKRGPEKRNPKRKYYNRARHDYEKDNNSSSERARNRLEKDKSSRTSWDGNCKYQYYRRSNRDGWSSERETPEKYRRSSCHRDSYSQDWRRRTERRSGSRSSRSRHSKSSESTFRQRNSRTPERRVRRSSSNIKDRKAESRHSSSFDKYSSNTRRDSPVRKRRRRSFSRSPSSVWSRLDSNSSPPRRKKGKVADKRSSVSKSSKKRPRTPFLVELERKLREVNRSKKDMEVVTVNDVVPMLQVPPVLQQNLNPLSRLSLPIVPVFEGLYHFRCQPMPTLSVNNLPLIPGPTGLPVHITPTGEQIPHDMDGKPIPVGPNGFYLPVDPTGRLFPHIVSPGNQAIPIHMTDDGVLRLPDSEPVPYGPSHQLPVNIDGTVIYIGPDSKPLFPYPNLPRAPPHLLNRTQVAVQEMPQMGNQQVAPVYPVQLEPQPPSISGHFRTHHLEVDLITPETSQTPPEINRVENPPEKQKQTETEKTKNDLVDAETGNSSDVDPPGRAAKRPISPKLLQSKAPRNNSHSNGPEINLEPNGSVPDAKTALESGKGSNTDDAVIQDEEQGFLEIVCDYKSFPIPIAKLASDDPIVRKTECAIKSLSEKNYKPPVFGRFIISDLSSGLVARKFPNESPLFRNRIKLPFVTPSAKEFYHLNRPIKVEKTKVTFKFLPQKSETGERLASCKYNRMCTNEATGLPVLTFDFAVQCDFTSVIIRKLNARVSELETEVVRLRKANANLLVMNEKKSDELRKALLEIQERNSEILALKCPLKVQQ